MSAAKGCPPELFAVRWSHEPAVRLLDQTLLPERVAVVDCRDVDTLAEAIRSLRVRGAPALGVAGAYGVVLGALTSGDAAGAAELLASQRPTAVNLGWACARVLRSGPDTETMLAEARAVEAENAAACAAIGRHGAALLSEHPSRLLTHCNTGMLACQGIGTAFGVARTLWEQGGLRQLWVDETRPLLQGARLTAFEAAALGMPHAVVADGAAGALMAQGEVDAVVVGADRVAANGDVANKVGTYVLAVLAEHHAVPFYVAAPLSTVDLGTADGRKIAIEERDADEVRTALGRVRLAPADSPARNPAFDITPARLVSAVITEAGVARAPYRRSLAALVESEAGRPGAGLA